MSCFPRAITLERAREILRDQSRLNQRKTDLLAQAWHEDPNFSRAGIGRAMGTSRQTVDRLRKVLDDANELAEQSAPPAVETPVGEHRALSGPQLLAMIDTQLREADADGRNRDFQVLLNARQSIADASSEVAAAYVDPMRLCGPRGLKGMPERIIKVIEIIRPHMRTRYPALWTYLCEFGKKHDTEVQRS